MPRKRRASDVQNICLARRSVGIVPALRHPARGRLPGLWLGRLLPRGQRAGLSRFGRRDKNKKKNPFLGARLQSRDPAGHNRKVHVRGGRRREGVGKHGCGTKGLCRGRRAHCAAAIPRRCVPLDAPPLELATARRLPLPGREPQLGRERRGTAFARTARCLVGALLHGVRALGAHCRRPRHQAGDSPFGLAAAGYAAGGTGFSQGHRRLSQPPSRVPLLLRHSRRGRGFALSARRGAQLRAQGPDFHGAFAQCARELGHGRWV